MKMALIVFAFLLLILIGATVYFFVFAIVRRKEPIDFTSSEKWAVFQEQIKKGREWFENNAYEKVEIKSYDGLRLCGRLYRNVDSKKTLLLMHGYHSVGTNDFGCVGDFYFGLGFNLLVVDQRAHGESEGKYITFGVRERYDCIEWIKYLNGVFGEDSDIFLDGISMGAATVLMASGLDLPKNVRGIIADCGFTSPHDIFCHVLKKSYHLPPFPLIYTTDLLSRAVAGFGFREYSTIEAMKKNNVPVIFVHGADDDFVPTRMSRECYDACTAKKQITIVEGADHGMSYLCDRENCERQLKEFLYTHSTK